MVRFIIFGFAALIAWLLGLGMANTGRTNKRWAAVLLDDSGGTLRNIPVNSINGVGLDYGAADVTAFTDAIKNVLTETPDCVISIKGPLDTTANTGSHTVLAGVAGGNTPLSMDIQIGVRHAWESGEPQFGITSSASSGMLVTKYTVNLDDMMYEAELRVIGSTAPAWGTTAES